MLSIGSGSHPSSSLLPPPSHSPHESVMLKTLHWSWHHSRCLAMPSHHGTHYSHLQHWCLSPSQLLWQTYIHNCTDKYNSQLLTAWLVTKILLRNVALAKHILSFTSFTNSNKHTIFVLEHFTTFTSKPCSMLVQLVDDTQSLHCSKMTYPAEK
jgi:hypothetical protein